MEKILITNSNQLKELCAEITAEEYITIDTEFMREHTYYPKLCLVQIGLAQKAAIIDPLCDEMDLSPLFEVLRDPRVHKVLHAARQDLEIFYLLMGEVISPLYDTQIAEMALGSVAQISYHRLVKKYLGCDLDKGSRMTHWDRRPLSEAQWEYAFNDVIPLHEIYPKQRQRLAEREEWIKEVSQNLSDPETLVISPQNAWKQLKYKQLKPGQMGAFVAAAAWREQTAQKKNLPRKWILSDESLLALAQNMPKNLSEAESLRLKPKNVYQLKTLLQEMQNSTPVEMPQQPKEKKLVANEDLLHLFRLALQHCARQHDFATRLLCTSEELYSLATMNPSSPQWKAHILQQGWRREVFGKFAEKIALGNVSLRFDQQRMCFEEI